MDVVSAIVLMLIAAGLGFVAGKEQGKTQEQLYQEGLRKDRERNEKESTEKYWQILSRNNDLEEENFELKQINKSIKRQLKKLNKLAQKTPKD